MAVLSCHCEERPRRLRGSDEAIPRRIDTFFDGIATLRSASLHYARNDTMMNISYEYNLRSSGYTTIAGLDEAGRGPLAGPVVAAAVVFDFVTIPDELTDVKDSKKLSAKKRAELFSAITRHAQTFALGICDRETIDRINILQATFLAMKKALGALEINPDIILLDGSWPLPNYSGRQRAVVRGDNSVFSIAAASILAKVARDRIMDKMHERYPRYFFNRHKGYGTELHLNALKLYGPCAIHRRSFRPIKNFYNYSKAQMSNYSKSMSKF